MFAFIIVYLGAMFFIEKKYNYDWTPATPAPFAQSIKEVLQKEGLPTSFEENAGEDSVIAQGILPAENKNYLTQDFDYLQEEPKENKENLNQEENQPLQEQALQEKDLQEEILQETLPAQEEPKPADRPLTFKEQLETKDLVDIETLPVKIFLDLRYATENNFTGQKLYKKAKCYLKKPTALALEKAAKAALQEEAPFYFCVYDCYRPSSVQKTLLKYSQQEGFVSKVSNHSRGMAIDLGPCDENGEPLLTPTEFDTFSPLSAAYTYDDAIPQLAIKNRTSLQKVMKEAGFNTISKEWWHFDFKGANQQEVLNIKF